MEEALLLVLCPSPYSAAIPDAPTIHEVRESVRLAMRAKKSDATLVVKASNSQGQA